MVAMGMLETALIVLSVFDLLTQKMVFSDLFMPKSKEALIKYDSQTAKENDDLSKINDKEHARFIASELKNSKSFAMMCNYGRFNYQNAGEKSNRVRYVNPHLCSHLIFYEAIAHNGRLIPELDEDKYVVDEAAGMDQSLYYRMSDLRIKNPKLKIYLAIGEKTNKENFEKTLARFDRRKLFSWNVVKYLRKWKFDGLVIDLNNVMYNWKFPLLCETLMDEFKGDGERNNRLRLHILAVVSDKLISTINRYVDYVILNSYNFASTWKEDVPAPDSVSTEAKAPLRKIQRMANIWSAAVGARKVIVGLSTFGRTYTLKNPSNDGGMKVKVERHGDPADYSESPGFIHYFEVCLYLQHGYQEFWDDESKTPYAFKENQWISYDNQRSLNLKADYVKHANLGGVCLWEITESDFLQMCGHGYYPLVSNIRNKLLKDGIDVNKWRPPEVSLISEPVETIDEAEMQEPTQILSTSDISNSGLVNDINTTIKSNLSLPLTSSVTDRNSYNYHYIVLYLSSSVFARIF